MPTTFTQNAFPVPNPGVTNAPDEWIIPQELFTRIYGQTTAQNTATNPLASTIPDHTGVYVQYPSSPWAGGFRPPVGGGEDDV